MKRILAPALLVGFMASFGLVGCGEETKVKEQETVATPGGTTTTTTETKVKSTGDNPPANSSGETGNTAPAK